MQTQTPRAVTTSVDVVHGLSIAAAHEPTTLIILDDSLIFDSTIVEEKITAEEVKTPHNPDPEPRGAGHLWRRLRRAAAGVVQLIRSLLAAATSARTRPQSRNETRRTLRHRYRYVGGHRTRANAFGRYRSTAELHGELNRSRARHAASGAVGDLEDELQQDIEWFTWVERYIQRLRDEGIVIHTPGRHFICS